MDWQAICDWLAASGVRDSNGGVPSPASARQAWSRVRRGAGETQGADLKTGGDMPPIEQLVATMDRDWQRSALYKYMQMHHDALAAVCGGRVNWTELAPWFASNGLTDGEGKAPSAQTLRRTWRVVRENVRARREQDERQRQQLEDQREESLVARARRRAERRQAVSAAQEPFASQTHAAPRFIASAAKPAPGPVAPSPVAATIGPPAGTGGERELTAIEFFELSQGRPVGEDWDEEKREAVNRIGGKLLSKLRANHRHEPGIWQAKKKI